MVRISGRLPRVAMATAGVTAAGLLAAVALNASLGAHPAGAVGAPPQTVAPGTEWVWGDNSAGETQPAAPSAPLTKPTPMIFMPAKVVQVAAAGFHAYALLSDGTVRAWGANSSGQSGNGTTGTDVLAQPTGLRGITQVAASNADGFAIGAGGIVFGWGDNSGGQLGDGTTTTRLTPVHIGGLSGIQQVAAGQHTTYALDGDGAVWSWGTDLLGDGVAQRLRPAKIPGLTGVVQVAASDTFTMALRSDGTVWAWGDNGFDQLGRGVAGQPDSATPLRVVNAAGIRQIAAGFGFALAVDSAGRVWGWGDNRQDETGVGVVAGLNRTVPGLVAGLSGGIVQVAAGLNTAAAVRADGTMLAWGSNLSSESLNTPGTLGTGSTQSTVVSPTQVPERANITQVAMGNLSTFAITTGYGESYGYAWANNASPALNTPYSPSTHYAFDSTGARVAVTRTATGAYTVDFPGLAAQQPVSGNVQVTAFGTTANRCRALNWFGTGTTLEVQVVCTDLVGTPADTLFVAQYFHGGAGRVEQGYALATLPTTASYTPSMNFTSSSTPITVVRNGVGQYTATLPGLPIGDGSASVSAFGATNAYCNVVQWANSDVHVACYNLAGAPVDTMWSLNYADQGVANNGHPGASVLADNPTAPSYTPNLTYQWDSAGGQITITRSTTGTYKVQIPGLADVDATSAMVTAYGGTTNSCAVNGWAASGTGTAVNVLCHNAAGSLADATFTLSYLTNF